jgi:hypothetical protein
VDSDPTVYGPVMITYAHRINNTPNGNARYALTLSNGVKIRTKPDSAYVNDIQNMLNDGMFGGGTHSSILFTYTVNGSGQLDSVTRV